MKNKALAIHREKLLTLRTSLLGDMTHMEADSLRDHAKTISIPTDKEVQMEADEPVTVYTINNPCEAEVIRSALLGQGISCQLDGEGQAGLSDILEIGVLVRARDADRARKFIRQNEAKHPDAATRPHADHHHPEK